MTENKETDSDRYCRISIYLRSAIRDASDSVPECYGTKLWHISRLGNDLEEFCCQVNIRTEKCIPVEWLSLFLAELKKRCEGYDVFISSLDTTKDGYCGAFLQFAEKK